MKKIGILTFHNTTNYGALLQAFALQMKIKELHGNCEIINYHCKNIEEREAFSFPAPKKNVKKYISSIKKYINLSNKRNKIKDFSKRYLEVSNREYNRDNIYEANDQYEKFIVGSDMVFELGITNGDMTYYLDFAEENKRYSYAASLGVEEIDKKYFDNCIENLNKFQYLSVREQQAQEYFTHILEKKVYLDVDPTLLYDGTFWQKYEEKPKKMPEKKYILLYFLDKDGIMLDKAKSIAKEKDYDLISLSNIKNNNNCKVITDASIGEFLYYIHNAELVITASFHGMIFSINYNTNFMYFNRGNSSSRLENIAIITDTQNRRITKESVPKIECNFQKINETVEEVRQNSSNHLKRIIDKR